LLLLISQTLYFLHRSTGVFVSEFVLLVRSIIFSIRSSGVFVFRLSTKLFMNLFTFEVYMLYLVRGAFVFMSFIV